MDAATHKTQKNLLGRRFHVFWSTISRFFTRGRIPNAKKRNFNLKRTLASHKSVRASHVGMSFAQCRARISKRFVWLNCWRLANDPFTFNDEMIRVNQI
jgi:hypothetical protein